MSLNDFVFRPIRQLSHMVRNREVSSVELVNGFIERLERIGSEFNAVVKITPERALVEAQCADEEIARGCYRGPLHGIPYGVKDLLATNSIPTTWGATPFRNQVFDYDATVIRNLLESGAVLVAKLAMVELAGGMGYERADSSFTGPGLNPWDKRRWSGGSSSGSGASIAAGLVPFAIGSETWGSILIPASFCGISGFRPTYGRVSRYGAMSLSWTLDKLGPLCLNADDCGLVLDAISGPDPKDGSTANRFYRYDGLRERSSRIKLAIPKDSIAGHDEDTQKNFEAALDVLKNIADIEEVELPDYPYEAAVTTIINAESASAFEEFVDEGKPSELADRADRFGPYARRAVLATEYLKAMRLRPAIARDIDELLAPYEAIVAPTSGEAPSTDDVFDRVGRGRRGLSAPVSAIGNLIGLPAITVPNGFTRNGLPTGIQFMGRAYDENPVLFVASEYQSLTDWHNLHPKVPD